MSSDNSASSISSSLSLENANSKGDRKSSVRRVDDSTPATSPLLQSVIVLNIESPSGKSVKVETSPTDCVLDVRQFLLECVETCEYTCYHLAYNGLILNDYCELADYADFLMTGQMVTLKIVTELYDERAARLHVRRLREILVKPPAQIIHTNIPALEEEENKDKKKGKKNNASSSSSSSSSTEFDIATFHTGASSSVIRRGGMNVTGTTVECVRNITFSAWNPPPGNRKLRGDLLYLEITTLENHVLYVTAAIDGFFVNSSTLNKFDPNPAESAYKSHSLVELLRKASPLFASRFHSLLHRKITIHPLDQQELNRPAPATWLAHTTPHQYDWNRAEDAFLSTYGADVRGVMRDWNEEIQSCRELPHTHLNEKIMKDRTAYRVYCDFTEAALKGASAVVHGHIPPVNPMDPPRQYVFIHNNIFFSFAIDGRDLYEKFGGDKVSYVHANHDLHGVYAYSELELSELYTLATALIDYRGHRVLAQSIIPGIFHGDRASKHVYGSMDQGEKVERDEKFHSLVAQAAEKLHLAVHAVVDKEGKEVLLATNVESKGIIGSDGRSYILDLLRITPRDANYADFSKWPTALLRQELVSMYCKKLAYEHLIAEQKKKKEEKDSKKKEEESKDKLQEEVGPYHAFLTSLRYNPDSFTNARLGGESKSRTEDENSIKSMSSFLKSEVIPGFIADVRDLKISPIDGVSLTTVLHEHGINVRYLGTIAEQAKEAHLPHIETLCIQEMLVRSAKHLFHQILRDVAPDRTKKTENWYFGPTIARFLSAFLGPNCAGHKLTEEQINAAKTILKAQKDEVDLIRAANVAAAAAAAHPEDAEKIAKAEETAAAVNALIPGAVQSSGSKNKKNKKKNKKTTEVITAGANLPVIRLADGSRAPTDLLASTNVWQAIRDLVQDKYSYTLPIYLPLTSRSKLSMLRSFCLKSGIVLAVKDYDLTPSSSNTTPFTIDDILDLTPVLKVHLPRSQDALRILETGRVLLAQQRHLYAYQFLMEALNLHTNIYGAFHVDTAACYTTLASALYHAGDALQAVDYQQRAVIILERVLGADHHETAHAHMHLALYLHAAGHIDAALKHIKRALFLFELLAGPNHPDTAAAHTNLGMLYQDTGKFADALKHVEIALERNLLSLGADHVQVGLSHHFVAVALALNNKFRQAITHEKNSKSILSTTLGASHPRVQQANTWLSHFTSLAVKHESTSGAAAGLLLSPAAIVPPNMSAASLVSWVSYHNPAAPSSKGIDFSVDEVLKLFEQRALQEEQAKQAEAKEGEAVAAAPADKATAAQ